MRAARPYAALHRFARLLALATLVLYQPLAAVHFATDQAHIANSATSIQVAASGHAHGHGGETPGHHHHPAHDDALCEFCLLAGAALAPLAGGAVLGMAWNLPPDAIPVEAPRRQERLRLGHPARAPPPAV